MRCNYCRSITHDKDCPKEFIDNILPVYSAAHKLLLIEQRMQSKQTEVYVTAEGKGALEQYKTSLKKLVDGENAKNNVAVPVVAGKAAGNAEKQTPTGGNKTGKN